MAHRLPTLLLLALLVLLGACSTSERENMVFLGEAATAFIDPSGTLRVEEVSQRRDELFRDGWDAIGDARSLPRQARIWVSLPMPDVKALASAGWRGTLGISINEPRIERVEASAVSSGGRIVRYAWDWSDERRRAGNGYRYPFIGFEPEDLQDATVFLRITTRLPFDQSFWLSDFQTFFGNYNAETTLLSVVIGVKAAILLYILTLAISLRSATNLWLAACMAAGLFYVLCESGFLEAQLWPGQAALSQTLALASRPLLQATLILFALNFLRLFHRSTLVVRLAKILAAIHATLSLASLLSLDLALAIRPLVVTIFGSATILVLAALSIAAARTRSQRVVFFVVAGLPSLLPVLLGWIVAATPAGTQHTPVIADGIFLGISLSLILFAIYASFDVRQREKLLRSQILSNVERFRGFAEIGTDSFWEIDAAGRLTFLSGRTIQPTPLAVGNVFADVLEAASTAEYIRPIRETIADRLPFDDRRVRLSEDGRDVWISLSGRAIDARSGERGDAVYRGIARDVTEETERESRRVVEQQMLALGQLVGSVAHEVNNLLHPIVNLTKRLRNRRSDADPESAHLMDLIDLSSRQAASVVSELLRSTRDQRWKDIDRPLSLAVKYSVEAVRPALPASVKVDVVTEEVGRPTVKMGDILQVVGNLLSNAVHAMDGRGQVTVALAAVPEGARLTVADDGAGMEESVRRRAMQPFFTTKTDGRGTGVGLYVVQRIIRDYGGWITIDSTPGLGTTFTILFPLRKEDDGRTEEDADGARG